LIIDFAQCICCVLLCLPLPCMCMYHKVNLLPISVCNNTQTSFSFQFRFTSFIGCSLVSLDCFLLWDTHNVKAFKLYGCFLSLNFTVIPINLFPFKSAQLQYVVYFLDVYMIVSSQFLFDLSLCNSHSLWECSKSNDCRCLIFC
jgi:hypothetical protein